jgi:mevalonate kinase
MVENTRYYAHGKLLITGEYSVLDGALAVAIPTKLGQWLEISTNENLEGIHWVGMDVDEQVWFECRLSSDLEILEASDLKKAISLVDLLKEAIKLNPNFKQQLEGCVVNTKLEFHQSWGLGSSSTLIQLLSDWANINPYDLLNGRFQGSGYDIACAKANGPISYQLVNGQPIVKEISFLPEFSDQLFLIYLGKKQFSDKEITKYSQLKFDRIGLSKKISEISNQLINCTKSAEFSALIQQHEDLLSEVLNYPKVKDQFFESITGTFKSLGAWGGDFCLFLGEETEIPKIKKLGFDTIIKWNDLLKL